MNNGVRLAGRRLMTARLRRLGGELCYNDSHLSAGSRLKLVEVASGVASLVRSDGCLVPVLASDMTDETFEFQSGLSEAAAQEALAQGSRQELFLGNQLEPVGGIIIQRTGRPFASFSEASVPHGEELVITGHRHGYVFYELLRGDRPRRAHFYGAYLTDAYFTVG